METCPASQTVKNSGGLLVKKMLFAAALIAALIPMAVAQSGSRLPQASLDRDVDVIVPARPAVLLLVLRRRF
jgi:hypothetical protein